MGSLGANLTTLTASITDRTPHAASALMAAQSRPSPAPPPVDHTGTAADALDAFYAPSLTRSFGASRVTKDWTGTWRYEPLPTTYITLIADSAHHGPTIGNADSRLVPVYDLAEVVRCVANHEDWKYKPWNQQIVMPEWLRSFAITLVGSNSIDKESCVLPRQFMLREHQPRWRG